VRSGELPQRIGYGGPGPRVAPSARTPGSAGRTLAAAGEARRTRTRG
jgi:hypothetical protein